MDKLFIGLGFLAFLLVLGLVGNEDYEYEVRSQVNYCQMVEAGIWPDYNETYQYCDKAYNALAKIQGE